MKKLSRKLKSIGRKGANNMNKKEIIKQGINLFNKHFPNDKHTTEKEKTSLVKFFIGLHELNESKRIKVLQSKVKTYEQDIISNN